MTSSSLKPSKFSLNGFLGRDKRPVSAIIRHDQRVLKACGVSLKLLAARLKRAYGRARSHLGAEADVGKNVSAVYEGARGALPCPLCAKTFEKGEVVLRRTSGETLSVTALSVHLIEKHRFFQGKGSAYRVDPGTAVEFLGLGNKRGGKKA